MHAKVIGAGVAGLATAIELIEQGATVTVVERSAEFGQTACSWLAGGMLAPFCEGESAPAAVTELGRQAIDWWERHASCVRRQGTLVVAPPRDAGEVERFASHTHSWQRLDEAGVGTLEPDLAGRFRKGLFFADEGHLDPRVALTALRDQLIQRGAVIQLGVDGTKSETCADITIDCRGHSARGEIPEMRGVRGEMFVVRTRELKLRRPVRLLHPRIPIYVVPREDHLFMIGATMIESDDGRGVSVRSAIELLSAAYALHPAFGEAEIVEMNAGVRPAFADNQPRVLETGGHIHVNGFFRHGFLLAPAFAKRAAALAMHKTTGNA